MRMNSLPPPVDPLVDQEAPVAETSGNSEGEFWSLSGGLNSSTGGQMVPMEVEPVDTKVVQEAEQARKPTPPISPTPGSPTNPPPPLFSNLTEL